MRCPWLPLLWLLGVRASHFRLRPANQLGHRHEHYHNIQNHPMGHHLSTRSGAYVHNGILHRPQRAAPGAREAQQHHGLPPHGGGGSPAGAPHHPHATGAAGAGHTYIPPSDHSWGPSMGGSTGGLVGGAGLGGVAGSALPAIATGTAIANMAGAHRRHSAARSAGAIADWQSIAICNAYASLTPLTVVHTQPQLNKTSAPLLYKTCRAHDQVLHDGDTLRFQAGDLLVGTFNVTHAVNRGIMVLVVMRDSSRGRGSTGAAFVSHALRRTAPHSAVLVDTLLPGGQRSAASVEVRDGQRALDFPSEVPMQPGAHVLTLVNTSDQQPVADTAAIPLEVPNDSSSNFLVVRVGHDGMAGGAPEQQELLVLPLPIRPLALATHEQQPRASRSRATAAGACLLPALAAAAAAAPVLLGLGSAGA